ncbi:glycosyltransferase family 4 protein [uncultured Pontibacter sp.]|uniref:glycosyltransferase family 4 protein n=1 Tax=uncultured Pontibacter sp. TaxID=453356 RepID=UPI002616910E|nr:glycosyltransferase family 4 protein [uncultured Pontibacter sp.]
MKVLLIIDSLYTGGAEISSLQLMSYLKSKGHAVKLCKLQDRIPEYDPSDFGLTNETITLNGKYLIEQVTGIVNLIKEFKPDVVHSVLFKSNIRTRLAKAIFNFLHVESLVSCPYDNVRLRDPKINKLGFYVYKYMDKMLVTKGVDYCIAITEQVKRHYNNELRIPGKKIGVISRGREVNEFKSIEKSCREDIVTQLGIDKESVLLIHVGRQEYAKGHLIFLKALTDIYKKKSEVWRGIKVLFCGREGNETSAILDYLSQHPYLSENIYWLGHRSDIPKLLVSSDLFVFPSLYEGLGGALIEAQAAGLPIICSDLPVFSEVVVDKVNALMFPIGNEIELSKQLVKLVQDAALRESMSKRSLENFNNKFNLRKINEETLKFYQQIIS